MCHAVLCTGAGAPWHLKGGGYEEDATGVCVCCCGVVFLVGGGGGWGGGGGGARVRVRACAACSICVWFEHEHPCVYSTYVNSYLCCASVNNQLCCIVACEEHPGSATGTNCVPYNLIVLLASDTDLQQFRLIYLNQPKRGLAKHAVHSYFR